MMGNQIGPDNEKASDWFATNYWKGKEVLFLQDQRIEKGTQSSHVFVPAKKLEVVLKIDDTVK